MAPTAETERTFRMLEGMLKQECELYRKYQEVSQVERKAIVSLQLDTIYAQAWKREDLCEAMKSAAEKRAELIKDIPEAKTARLSEIIARHCDPSDAKRLMPIVKELRTLIAETRLEGYEMTQVLSFSQRLVAGTLSILQSASLSITKLYTRKGAVKEEYVPVSDRAASPRKQA